MITLITGGMGSGKTTMALKLASAYAKKLYVATAEPIDSEMQEKIRRHQAERDHSYTTLEVPIKLPLALAEDHTQDVILVDCLTMWVSNLSYYSVNIDGAFADLYKTLEKISKDVILVTNEVCMGLIGGDTESREYQKALSYLNKHVARMADRVCLMVSGIPMWIK